MTAVRLSRCSYPACSNASHIEPSASSLSPHSTQTRSGRPSSRWPAQAMPTGVGIAWAGQRLDGRPDRVWVLCGDSELAEGSMWEAFEQAGYEHLDNLTAVIDVNRLGQRGETRHGWDLDAYARR